MVAAINSQGTQGHGVGASESSLSRLVTTAGSIVGVVEGSFEFAWFVMSSIRGGQLWAGQGMAPPSLPLRHKHTAAAKALLELTSTRLLDLSKIPSKKVLDLQQLLRDLTRVGGIPLDSFELDDLSSDDDMVDDDYDD